MTVVSVYTVNSVCVYDLALHHMLFVGRGMTSCRDKFKNCRVVVQARLCRYSYYRGACCFSCTSHGYDDNNNDDDDDDNTRGDA